MRNLQPTLTAFFAALPFLYLATIYGGLPERVPIHFDWRGEPDGWGPKYILWLLPTIGVTLMLLITASMRKKTKLGGRMAKQAWLGVLTIAFISLLFCFIIRSAETGEFLQIRGLSILIGTFFAASGNYFPVLERNRWIGIRTPATLSSDAKWRAAHRFGGPVFVVGGALMVLNGLLFSGDAASVVFLALIALTVLVTIGYTLRLPDAPDDDLV